MSHYHFQKWVKQPLTPPQARPVVGLGLTPILKARPIGLALTPTLTPTSAVSLEGGQLCSMTMMATDDEQGATGWRLMRWREFGGVCVGRQVHLRGRSVLKPSRIASPQVATCDDGMDNGWYVEQVFTVGS